MWMAFFVSASTQFISVLRTGNISAWMPFWSITQTSRSVSNGAIEAGSHLSGSGCTFDIGKKTHADLLTALMRINPFRKPDTSVRMSGHAGSAAMKQTSLERPYRLSLNVEPSHRDQYARLI